MLQLPCIIFLGLASLLPQVLAYPQNTSLGAYPQNSSSEAWSLSAKPKFILGAIGDSWGSGVTYAADNQYDDNKSGCMRYKYAWSTVVNANYTQWTPDTGEDSQFEFVSCAGAKLENMMGQMDQLTRPKLVLMEAGGNNAIFYPMADACLFHSNLTKDYGTLYENDNAQKPEGECRKEIQLVRNRLQGNDMQNRVVQTIHDWRGHKSVMGNDASLFLLGYGRFFGLDDNCDQWNFCVWWNSLFNVQNVVKDMRVEINALGTVDGGEGAGSGAAGGSTTFRVGLTPTSLLKGSDTAATDLMNGAIRQAAESFNDPKIQYIDINPAFDNHRFCEPGQTEYNQFNWGDEVYFWNSPGRYFIVTKNGKVTNTYDTTTGPSAPFDIVEKLMHFPQGKPIQEGAYTKVTFSNPANPDLSMEYYALTNDLKAAGSDAGGSIARTLHPTEDGHREMGNIIIRALEQHYGRT